MSELTEFRHEKDAFFGTDQQSPLTHDQRHGFAGLDYYDENGALALTLEPEVFEQPETIEMQTSTGDLARYQRWARVSFEVTGAPASLTIYRDVEGGGLFLPFQDANAGGDTYGAGRYLDVHPVEGRAAPDRLQLRLQPLLRLQRAVVVPDPARGEPSRRGDRGG